MICGCGGKWSKIFLYAVTGILIFWIIHLTGSHASTVKLPKFDFDSSKFKESLHTLFNSSHLPNLAGTTEKPHTGRPERPEEVYVPPQAALLEPPPVHPPNNIQSDDRLVNFNASYYHEWQPSHPLHLERNKYLLIIPTWSGHFQEAKAAMHSFICLSTDIHEVEIAYILSNDDEMKQFRKLLDDMPACGRKFHRWPVDPSVDARPPPKYHLYNMYDLLPREIQHFAEKEDTGELHGTFNKFRYQSIKKMTASYELDYDWAWWLDSEAIAVQPFSFRKIMDQMAREPIVWRSRNAEKQAGANIMIPTARVLGRSVESFGSKYWNLEEVTWIFEKKVFMDMYNWVEQAHDRPFWEVFFQAQPFAFEITLMNMHIQSRKLETTDELFTKYKVLEVERELTRYGVWPGLKRWDFPLGGIMERLYRVMLKTPEMMEPLRNFMQRHHIHIVRVDDMKDVDSDVMEEWLLTTPVYILVNGAPSLYEWWDARELEAQGPNADEEDSRKWAEDRKKKEADRKKNEEDRKEKAEAEAKKLDDERKAAEREKLEQVEKEKQATEDAKKKEQEKERLEVAEKEEARKKQQAIEDARKKEQVEKERLEVAKKEQEDRERLEAQRKEQLEKERLEAQRKEQQDKELLEVQRKGEEEAARKHEAEIAQGGVPLEG